MYHLVVHLSEPVPRLVGPLQLQLELLLGPLQVRLEVLLLLRLGLQILLLLDQCGGEVRVFPLQLL